MKLPKKPKTLDEAWSIIVPLLQRIDELESENAELKRQLNKNSRNSGKPPSSDGLSKPKLTKSQREKSGRKPGGQNGHQGKTLELVEHPDEIIRHTPEHCDHCQKPLGDSPIVATQRRQIFEMPPIKVKVTEHQLDVAECLNCHTKTCAPAPEGVTSSVVYGSQLQAFALYMMNQQLIPYERVVEIFRDFLKVPISAGTLFSMQQRCFDTLEPVSEEIKEKLTTTDVVNFDESGLRCAGALHWLHVATSPSLTHYDVHAKRGKEAMADIGILPLFNGTAIHDHLKSYFDFSCQHGLCNIHHLRELTFVGEHEHETWAKDMKDLLMAMYNAVENRKESGMKKVSAYQIKKFEKEYKTILNKGFAYHEILPDLPRTGKRGRKKQRPGKNLLDRLKKKQSATLLFLHDFSVPFTNNLAEQDIRMIKVKQKISGCFRTLHGAHMFCRIRGYLSTARKNRINLLNALSLATTNPPSLSMVLELA